MPILLYAVEACPLLVRQILSTDFTLIRIFMKVDHQVRLTSAKLGLI